MVGDIISNKTKLTNELLARVKFLKGEIVIDDKSNNKSIQFDRSYMTNGYPTDDGYGFELYALDGPFFLRKLRITITNDGNCTLKMVYGTPRLANESEIYPFKITYEISKDNTVTVSEKHVEYDENGNEYVNIEEYTNVSEFKEEIAGNGDTRTIQDIVLPFLQLIEKINSLPTDQGGGSCGFINILGRRRKITMKKNKAHVRYNSELITLNAAKKLDKKTKAKGKNT